MGSFKDGSDVTEGSEGKEGSDSIEYTPHHYSQVAELSCSQQQKVAEQAFDKTVIGSHKQIFNVFSF
ncbi:MAG: hypothetical protein WBD50_03910 [Candidatus Rhabdochlamydia sp.]